jgi:hypothetical protein
VSEPEAVSVARAKWDAACRSWSADDCSNVIVTMQTGERLMYAATDLICALEDALSERAGA